MAEEALYGNLKEPKFPFDRVIDRLDWLPSYLSAYEPKHSSDWPNRSIFPALLDTVFVFARARTAAFHGLAEFEICRELAGRLNSVLEDVGKGATHHWVELVRRGPMQYFITCTNSPRFDWNIRLTHFAIGKNLDYSAAGHMFNSPYPPRALIRFLDRELVQILIVECVLLTSLDNDDFLKEVIAFNNKRETLMNETLERLGLRYRIQWILDAPGEHDRVAEVMKNPVPPDTEWWQQNWIFVNSVSPTLKIGIIPFCNYYTKHHNSWSLLQYLYFFNIKYNHPKYGDIDKFCGIDYWGYMRDVYQEVMKSLTKERSLDEIEMITISVRARLEKIAQAADTFDDKKRIIRRWWWPLVVTWRRYSVSLLGFLPYRILLSVEWIKLHVFQPWKLRTPLLYKGPPLPPGTEAFSIWQ
jgi:hypothetical protein